MKETLWILVGAVTLSTAACLTSGVSGAAADDERDDGPQLEITLEHGSEAERGAQERLERLLREHDLERWIFTHEILIDEETRIPHSHPVLTLNTDIEDDTDLLSTFVHEQLHWLESDRREATEGAIADFRKIFPEVPVRGSEGARDEYSTYLHLVVCDLEYQALTELIGKKRALEHLAKMGHYRWIYRQVLERPEVREINARHGFLVP